jgi:excisionase family DNA binding protein
MDPEHAGFINVTTLCSLLAISRPTAYAMLASGEVPSVKIGRTYRIPCKAVMDLTTRAHTGMKRK